MSEVTARQLPLTGIETAATLTPDELNKIVANWGESIQFSPPRGSIKNADALISDIAPMFLRQRRRAGARARSRAVAAKMAANIMLEAVRHRVPDDAEHFVKRREIIEGAIEQHKLDVALANGHLIAGVQAISFEINAGEHLVKEVLSVKWALSDIRQRHADVPIAVFAFPPTGGSARTAYRDARHAFSALHADIVTNSRQMEQWANEKALSIPVP